MHKLCDACVTAEIHDTSYFGGFEPIGSRGSRPSVPTMSHGLRAECGVAERLTKQSRIRGYM
ncbi:hypothetical protein AERO9AM_10246 [Aeromicrobium sp. 9AM]|nr:hypothetical protein AERO9AM_10246 [Aeromicrobium sp. 9AM]